MVNLEVPLPPTEEGLYIPAQLVGLGNLFGGKIKAIYGYPIGLAPDRVNITRLYQEYNKGNTIIWQDSFL